jgi:putative resolvase
MKLSDYAKKVGISYRTAWRWYKSGVITGYQQPTGTIIINLPETNQNPNKVVAIYCRVSDNGSKDNLERQAERLTQYALVQGCMG